MNQDAFKTNAVSKGQRVGAQDLGTLAHNFFGFDITPGFNIGWNGITPNSVATKKPTTKTTSVTTPTANPTAPVDSYALSPEEARAAANVRALRDQIMGSGRQALSAYDLIFGDLANLVKSRAAEVEKTAGENVGKLTKQYTEGMPAIDNSYAALGADSSTDVRDAKIKAKSGFDEGVAQLGKQKEADLAKIGQYEAETKAGYEADKSSIQRLLDRINQTQDEGDLRDARNQVEDKLSGANVGRAKLMTDQGAQGELSNLTADAGRFDAIKSSLDNIMASSLAGGTKSAAVQAVLNSSDLTEADKEKVKQQYGNVYDAPANP